MRKVSVIGNITGSTRFFMKYNSLKDIKSVLVLGSENIIVLAVVRALGRLLPDAKINTFSPDDGKKPDWYSSKFVNHCYYFQPGNESSMVSELIECIQNTQADIVLPAGEAYVRFLAVTRDAVKLYALLPPLPSPELFDQLATKNKLNEYLLANDFPHPVNYRLDDPVLNTWDAGTSPMLLKPVRGSSGTGMKKISDFNELQQVIIEYDPGKYFLQQEIQGEAIGCNLLAIDGKIAAYSIQKNLAKNGYNFSTAMEFMEQEEIYSITERLVQCSGYSGLANLDFLLDENDGHAKLIDFNPRFWVSVLGSKAAGINFAELYCLAALGHPIEEQKFQKCVYLMGKSSLKYYVNRLLHPFTKSRTEATYTDIWDRIYDFKPELARYRKVKG